MARNVLVMLVLAIVLTTTVIYAQEQKDEGQKSPPPVTKIVLYKHGMGYFERVGTIKDDATVTLDFKTAQMQDLLTSLYAIDYGKDCKITSIGYDSKDPIDKQLENFLIRVPENAALTQFLAQLKGVKAEVKIANETTRGTILGIEPVNQKMDNTVLTSYKVVLLGEDGAIKPFSLLEVSSFKILDERIQGDLQRVLDIYRNSKYADRKVVRIQTAGKGERNIQIGYLIEMPIWKTSYRLILGDDMKPYLQGWAIMENPTDEDWNDVNVSFIAGNPISFKLDLYTSYYPTRAVIDLATLIPLASNLIEMDALARGEMEAADKEINKVEGSAYAAPGAAYGGARGIMGKLKGNAPPTPGALAFTGQQMAQMLSQSISSIASGTQIGEMFAYESKTPISVGRRQAAMVPIVTENTEGTKVLYYRQSISPRLMNAFFLNNSSKLTLETGPVSIFEGSTAVGEGLIRQPLQPGMKEMIPYAIEAGCSIEVNGRNESKPIHKGSFVNGVMVLRQYDVREATYKLINKTTKDFTFYLDHPRTGDYALMEPAKFEEEIAGYYRFKMDLAAGKTLEFKVTEQKELSSQVYIQNESMDTVRFYLNQEYFSKQAKNFMKDVVGLMNDIAEQDRIVSDAKKEMDKLYKDQERYRENMKILDVNNPKESEKRAEYLDRLSGIEKRLETLDQTVHDATDKQRQIRQDLTQKIQGFTEE